MTGPPLYTKPGNFAAVGGADARFLDNRTPRMDGACGIGLTPPQVLRFALRVAARTAPSKARFRIAIHPSSILDFGLPSRRGTDRCGFRAPGAKKTATRAMPPGSFVWFRRCWRTAPLKYSGLSGCLACSDCTLNIRTKIPPIRGRGALGPRLWSRYEGVLFDLGSSVSP